MHLGRRLKFLWVVSLLLFSMVSSASGTRAATSKRVLIIDLPRLTFEDIPHYPNLTRLCNTAGVGIMAYRISGVATPEKIYLNLNSGKQLWSVEDSRYILGESEIYNGTPAGPLYRSLTGYHSRPGNGVYLGLPKTIQLNFKNDPEPNIGVIGKTLHQSGFKTAAIGNADTAEWLNRSGSILLVDERGLIDLAAVGGDTTVKAPDFPSGLRSNNAKILEYWRRFNQQAQVVSISLGDLERIERFRDWLTESRKNDFRKRALQEYDRFLGQLLAEVDRSQTMVVLYSVIAPEIEGRSQRLNPVIIAKPDLKPGLLVSNSTRRAALVTGQDMVSAFLAHLGVKDPDYLAGRPINSVPGRWQQAGSMLRELDLNYQVRWTLLPIHGYGLIILVVLGILGLVFWPRNRRFFQGLHHIYLFLLTIPAAFLLEAHHSPVQWSEIALWTFGLAGGLFLLVKGLAGKDNRKALLIISVFTVGLIFADGLNNGMLELRSFWGYSAVAAARFYGVGNEYMGFILGAYIVAVTLGISWFQGRKRWLLWVFWFVMAFFMFCPVFGANIGGGIAASIGLGMANFFWLGYTISKRKIASLFGALILMLVLVGMADFLIFGKQMSHFGQYLRLVNEQGLSAVLEMVARKWELNLTLMAYTGWSYVLISLLVVVPLLYKNPPRPVAQWLARYPEIAKGMLGFISTCIVAFLVNDSGIVAIATMFIFGFDMLLVTVVEECHSKELA